MKPVKPVKTASVKFEEGLAVKYFSEITADEYHPVFNPHPANPPSPDTVRAANLDWDQTHKHYTREMDEFYQRRNAIINMQRK